MKVLCYHLIFDVILSISSVNIAFLSRFFVENFCFQLCTQTFGTITCLLSEVHQLKGSFLSHYVDFYNQKDYNCIGALFYCFMSIMVLLSSPVTLLQQLHYHIITK